MNVALDTNMQTERERVANQSKIVRGVHLTYVAREYKLTVMTSSEELDFYLTILRCITVLSFLHGCEMLRLGFKFVVGSFLGGEKRAF